jgi:hypothetical protein
MASSSPSLLIQNVQLQALDSIDSELKQGDCDQRKYKISQTENSKATMSGLLFMKVLGDSNKLEIRMTLCDDERRRRRRSRECASVDTIRIGAT